MNSTAPLTNKEDFTGPISEQEWLSSLSSEVFIDSPESLNLTLSDSFDIHEEESILIEHDSRTLASLMEDDLTSSTYCLDQGISELDPGNTEYWILELNEPTSTYNLHVNYDTPAGTDLVISLPDINERYPDMSTTVFPDDFLNYERENDSKTHNLNDHDYAWRMPLIELNANRKGAHYKIFRDAVTVKNFNPSLKNHSGTRISFRTLSKVQVSDEIHIFAQYRTNDRCSQSPHVSEKPLEASLPSITIDDEIQQGEICECKCFRSHPTAAFCVTSERAEVSWSSMFDVPVARLKVKEESIVDLSIGFWSTKILKGHGIVGKKVFNQIVFKIFDRSNVGKEDSKEQIFFYKTCASVSRDIKSFYKEVEKALPHRPRCDLIPDATLKDSLSEDHQNDGVGVKKKLKTEERNPLKITINQDYLQEFLDLIKSTGTDFLKS